MKEKTKLEPCRICGTIPEIEAGTDGAEIICPCCGISTGYCKDTIRSIPDDGQPRWRWKSEGELGVHVAVRKWNRGCGAIG